MEETPDNKPTTTDDLTITLTSEEFSEWADELTRLMTVRSGYGTPQHKCHAKGLPADKRYNTPSYILTYSASNSSDSNRKPFTGRYPQSTAVEKPTPRGCTHSTPVDWLPPRGNSQSTAVENVSPRGYSQSTAVLCTTPRECAQTTTVENVSPRGYSQSTAVLCTTPWGCVQTTAVGNITPRGVNRQTAVNYFSPDAFSNIIADIPQPWWINLCFGYPNPAFHNREYFQELAQSITHNCEDFAIYEETLSLTDLLIEFYNSDCSAFFYRKMYANRHRLTLIQESILSLLLFYSVRTSCRFVNYKEKHYSPIVLPTFQGRAPPVE